MTPEALADLHGRCFPDRPWSCAEFESLLSQKGMIHAYAPDQAGFVIVQTIPPEAEILTIAVDPGHRRNGVARGLMRQISDMLVKMDVLDLMLEVAQDNAPARAFYASLRFAEVGRRSGYYARRTGPAVDALVLKCAIPVSVAAQTQESVDPSAQTRP